MPSFGSGSFDFVFSPKVNYEGIEIDICFQERQLAVSLYFRYSAFHKPDQICPIVRGHGFDAHRCTLSEWDDQPHWLSPANKGRCRFRVPF